MGPFIRTWLLVALCLALACPVFAAQPDIQLKSDTLIHYFERDVGTERNNQVLPVYEYLRLDYRPGQDSAASFHAYGWMRVNLGDDFFQDDTQGELLYAYLQYAPRDRDFQMRLGRQYVFEGVANESVDGLYGAVDINPWLSFSGYLGMPVSLEVADGRAGDGIVGGRVSWHRLGKYDLGLSYKFLTNDSDRDEELAGIDLSLGLPANVTLLGQATRNLLADQWGEHSVEARIPLWRFEFRPQYQYYTSDGFFSDKDNTSGPFRAQPFLESDTRIYGAEAYFYPSEDYEIGLKARHYEYDKRFGESDYLSAIFTWKWKIFSHFGAEAGRMEGDVDENRYTLGRGFFYLDLAPAFVTGDVVYVDYDEALYNEDSSLFASLGVGRRFLRNALRLKLSADYSSDPYNDEDIRTLLVAEYQYDR
ncbi:hypothetical protein [Desulfuromonas versatilis]|nr:hypothetical protein [Desulfuromonas versatilis]